MFRTEQFWGIPQNISNIPQGPQGKIFLKPTCVGLSSIKTVSIKNGSRLPLKFKLNLPDGAGVDMRNESRID